MCPPIPSEFTTLLSGGNDSLIKVWRISLRDGVGVSRGKISQIDCLEGHGCSVMSIKFAPRKVNFFASTSGDKTLRLWDSMTFICLRVLENHHRYVICCSIGPDGKFVVSGSNDRSLNIWNVEGLTQTQWLDDQERGLDVDEDLKSPDLNNEFFCPITQDYMRNPVKCSGNAANFISKCSYEW